MRKDIIQALKSCVKKRVGVHVYPRDPEEINYYQDRLKVPEGWIVTSMKSGAQAGIHSVFVSDPEHVWELEGKLGDTSKDNSDDDESESHRVGKELLLIERKIDGVRCSTYVGRTSTLRAVVRSRI